MTGIRSDMANHPLAQAARETNDYAEAHGLADTCEHYGLKIEDLLYMAQQRALRALYAQRGVNLKLKKPTVLALTHEDEIEVLKLVPAYMDGIMIGYRAREITAEEAGEK